MKKQNIKIENREQWLEAAVALMVPLFAEKGYTVPKVRVSCGWPSSRGLSKKGGSHCIGECWCSSAAEDKLAQIFISPRLKDEVGKQDVLATLLHELIHATVGNKAKHGKVFKDCAVKMGLEGKMTATTAGQALCDVFSGWMGKLGDYPHARLNPNDRPTKKQTTRMIACECGECGYKVRVSRKWLLEPGAPVCPCNKKSMEFDASELEGYDPEDEGGDE